MAPQRQKSRDAFERACRIIPGGVNSPARAFGAVSLRFFIRVHLCESVVNSL